MAGGGDADDGLAERVRADVARFGWHVVLVPPEEGPPFLPGWAHTIGLSEAAGGAELIAFGDAPAELHRLLNRIGTRTRRDGPLRAEAGFEDPLDGRPVALRPVAPRWVEVFLGNACWHYARRDLPVLQAFRPDPAGRHPWDPGFAPELPAERATPPLLFREAAEDALPPALAAALRAEGAL